MMLTVARSASVMVVMTVVCAWCAKTMAAGTPGAPVSHGICEGCAESELSALRFVLKGAA